MAKTCATCRLWSPPLEKVSKNVPYPMGECQVVTTLGTPLAQIDGPSGCDECDPYTRQVLQTNANFGCVLHEAIDAGPTWNGRPMQLPSSDKEDR